MFVHLLLFVSLVLFVKGTLSTIMFVKMHHNFIIARVDKMQEERLREVRVKNKITIRVLLSNLQDNLQDFGTLGFKEKTESRTFSGLYLN